MIAGLSCKFNSGVQNFYQFNAIFLNSLDSKFKIGRPNFHRISKQIDILKFNPPPKLIKFST
ncbi:hypothetical protein H740_09706 [Campylobacter showae CC57C]|uniref:Uncharacterized protein n=1 Tax=Campylobacter showae CC57C TaxID=1073353 RepID=M3JAW2_9BACT|nr:hypothetical protein H740_09706 [Campylobacter showae CC57C]